MKVLHTADLHIGKTIEGWDLTEDTRFVLDQVCRFAEEEKVQAVLLSGDIFDRSVPSEQALMVYGEFLTRLCLKDGIKVLAIAGNHDSGIRLASNSELIEASGLYYVAGVVQPEIKKVVLTDEYGPINFYLLPFFMPSEIKSILNIDPGNGGYNDDRALADLLARQTIDTSERNVLMAHLFAAGFSRSGSESFSMAAVAGVENVGIDRFDAFDYVALGHIHRPQYLKRETLRYAGSLLKYKISECSGPERSVSLVELGAKGDIQVSTRPIKPLHSLIELTGSFADLCQQPRDDDSFVFLHLTDPTYIPNARGALATHFNRILSIDYPNVQMQIRNSRPAGNNLAPADLIKSFYKEQTKKELDAEQTAEIDSILKELLEEAK